MFSRKKRNLAIIVVCALLLLAISGGYYFFGLNKGTRSTVPTNISESVTYPLYYPQKLPAGYNVNSDSFQASNQAVLYSITKDGASSLAVSIQPKPNNFNFDEFHLKKLSGSKEFLTPSGKAVIGVLKNRTVGSLVTDKSWVLVSAPDSVPAIDVETIMKNLVPAK